LDVNVLALEFLRNSELDIDSTFFLYLMVSNLIIKRKYKIVVEYIIIPKDLK